MVEREITKRLNAENQPTVRKASCSRNRNLLANKNLNLSDEKKLRGKISVQNLNESLNSFLSSDSSLTKKTEHISTSHIKLGTVLMNKTFNEEKTKIELGIGYSIKLLEPPEDKGKELSIWSREQHSKKKLGGNTINQSSCPTNEITLRPPVIYTAHPGSLALSKSCTLAPITPECKDEYFV